ncbi:hypothetical protein C8A01DRAFT_33293 [Parachaetomium inaequale]|uniref:AHC1-like C2H2 zinc-finger domain-containing protein n=1 Tax=Parachaetomium inaequale TaxID=2588326 RepID=A0AAN6PP02_9PEZI|nr:hypothetical protein C8A01DRAFT_33293 [Parachaetomium inaequale]
MPMFRFWTSDSRGGDQTVDGRHQLPDCAGHVAHSRSGLSTPVSPKKRRPSFVDTAACAYPAAKRFKTEQNGDLPSPVSASADSDETGLLRRRSTAPDLDAAKEAIQMQFGLEILLKHDELRLINQELARCQVALEQLRRCHLIPYPLQCPTPSQMLHISSGTGPALESRRGEPVPQWAPPFGVVEGPYARHYAKWLIPDPAFDGLQPEPQGFAATGRAKNTAEGRATRSSISDAVGSGKQRPARGSAGQRLQALSSGYPQTKDKHSPCIVKRLSDGLTVKLICIDCHRWDFSSTQGFINHCRIAHRRDFKSHEEAAVASGHPIEVDESGAMMGNDRKVVPAAAPSGLVHPLARSEPTSEHQVYGALLSRIKASFDLYKAGKLPGVSSIPGISAPSQVPTGESSHSFVGSSDVPYLSRLMQKKKLGGNLEEQVTEAKTKVDWTWPSPDAESDMDEATITEDATTPEQLLAYAARTQAVMRMPSRAAVSPSQPPTAYRAASNKGHRTTNRRSTDAESPELPETPLYDVEMSVDLSPNTAASNNAPSLVSDDGEYDDWDDGSASDASDAMETESVSDVAEIDINDNSCAEDDTPRPAPHRRGSLSKAAKLKQDEARHVTFVSPTPVPTQTKVKRKKKI